MDPRAIDLGRAPGVIVDAGQGWVFVGAEQALRVLDGPRLSPVPNAGFSLLWFEGEVIAAVPFQSCVAPPKEGVVGVESPAAGADDRSQVLVCELAGQRYALTGVEVLASGEFDRVGEKGDSVRFAGVVVPLCPLSPPAFFEPASAPGVHDKMFPGGDWGPSGPKDAGTT